MTMAATSYYYYYYTTIIKLKHFYALPSHSLLHLLVVITRAQLLHSDACPRVRIQHFQQQCTKLVIKHAEHWPRRHLLRGVRLLVALVVLVLHARPLPRERSVRHAQHNDAERPHVHRRAVVVLVREFLGGNVRLTAAQSARPRL